MKALTLTVFSLFLTLSLANAESIGERVREKIRTQDVRLDLDLFSFGVGDYVSLRGESGIRVFPNEDRETYSRSEPLSFRFRLGHQIPVGVVSVGGSTTTGLSGEFIRQFDSQGEAFNILHHPPYIFDNQQLVTARRVPITAERARSLSDKDYFRYQLRTAITANAGAAQELGLASIRAGYKRVFYGDFQIEIYKRGQDKVYVRASSLKQMTRNIGGGLHRSFALEVFDIPVLNTLADKIIPNNFFHLDISDKAKGTVFAIEYLFDLSNPQAAAAYNQFMYYRNWQLMDVGRVVSPLTGGNAGVRDTLTMHLTETEAISAADSHLPEDQARVRRIVKSQTNFSNESRGGRIDIRLIKTGERTSFVEQNISLTVDPRTNYNQFYRIATSNFDETFGGWLAFGNEEDRRGEANILYELNPNFSTRDFIELNFSYEETDNNFKQGSLFVESDLAQISGRIYKMLPGMVHGPEKDKDFNVIGPGVRGFVENQLPRYVGDEVYLNMDLVISKEALQLATRLTYFEIQNVIDVFLNRVFDDQARNRITDRDYGSIDIPEKSHANSVIDCNKATTQFDRQNCIREANARSIALIKDYIPAIFTYTSQKNFEQQWRLLVALQEDPLFYAVGSGILSRLIFRATEIYHLHFEDYVYYRMSIENQEDQKSVYEKGLTNRPEVFNELIKIRNRILNRRFDPSYFQ